MSRFRSFLFLFRYHDLESPLLSAHTRTHCKRKQLQLEDEQIPVLPIAVYRGRLEEPDLVRAEEYRTQLESKMDVYDTILSKQKYLAGDVRWDSLVFI